ncbi:hypothetical protein DBR47_14460 [Paucibacter sp. KBW04]|uniref:YdaS family helix-turn-helix protein n=1 Tax=Paucibacter sp. KBW04 TaxID=2153361 RepID=UPI000F57640D|nr:YdaS family helix-turn-helix protein [Paucibacter sp. KBW04]RQO57991.1 hypothetical protein DBR47_14460 [Paucibacter sp. KBW04]
MDITVADRNEIAALTGVNEQYLYQCLTGRKDMKTREAVRVERLTGGKVRRWHLRKSDWWLHWPELINAEGAPAVPQEQPAAEGQGA